MKKSQGHSGIGPRKLLTQQKFKKQNESVEPPHVPSEDARDNKEQLHELMISTIDESKKPSTIVDLGKSTLPYQVKV